MLEPPHRGGSNEYHNLYFEQKYDKISDFFVWKFSFFGFKFFKIYLNRRVFVMSLSLCLVKLLHMCRYVLSLFVSHLAREGYVP